MPAFPIVEVAIAFFIGMGPVKIVAPYLAATHGAPVVLRRRVATLTVAAATLTALILLLTGVILLRLLHLSDAALVIGGAIVMLAVGLQTVLAPDHGGEPPVPVELGKGFLHAEAVRQRDGGEAPRPPRRLRQGVARRGGGADGLLEQDRYPRLDRREPALGDLGGAPHDDGEVGRGSEQRLQLGEGRGAVQRGEVGCAASVGAPASDDLGRLRPGRRRMHSGMPMLDTDQRHPRQARIPSYRISYKVTH